MAGPSPRKAKRKARGGEAPISLLPGAAADAPGAPPPKPFGTGPGPRPEKATRRRGTVLTGP